MIKPLMIIFSLFWTSLVFAEYPYFNFKPEKLLITKERHRRYIKPQLRNIRTEFFHLAKKISFESDLIYKLREVNSKNRRLYQEYEQKCFKDIPSQEAQKECKSILNQTIKSLYASNQIIFKLRDDLISDFKIQHKNYNSYLKFSRYIDQIEIIIYTVISQLETKRLISNTSYENSFYKDKSIPLKLTKAYTLTNHSLTELLPKNIRPHFESLLFNFIIPLEEKMLQSFSPEWFRSRLGKLNLFWNTFNVNMTKGDITISRKNTNIIKIMHNRWNSILKLIF